MTNCSSSGLLPTTEKVKVKNYMRRDTKPTGAGIKRTKRSEPEEDLWGSAGPTIAIKKMRDMKYLKSVKSTIARVVMPLSGQALNPSKASIRGVVE